MPALESTLARLERDAPTPRPSRAGGGAAAPAARAGCSARTAPNRWAPRSSSPVSGDSSSIRSRNRHRGRRRHHRRAARTARAARVDGPGRSRHAARAGRWRDRDRHPREEHGAAGTFGSHVSSLAQLTASGEVVELRPGASDGLFEPTLGGMGLTGAILSAQPAGAGEQPVPGGGHRPASRSRSRAVGAPAAGRPVSRGLARPGRLSPGRRERRPRPGRAPADPGTQAGVVCDHSRAGRKVDDAGAEPRWPHRWVAGAVRYVFAVLRHLRCAVYRRIPL
jgi:hypothetical protein